MPEIQWPVNAELCPSTQKCVLWVKVTKTSWMIFLKSEPGCDRRSTQLRVGTQSQLLSQLSYYCPHFAMGSQYRLSRVVVQIKHLKKQCVLGPMHSTDSVNWTNIQKRNKNILKIMMVQRWGNSQLALPNSMISKRSINFSLRYYKN